MSKWRYIVTLLSTFVRCGYITITTHSYVLPYSYFDIATFSYLLSYSYVNMATYCRMLSTFLLCSHVEIATTYRHLLSSFARLGMLQKQYMVSHCCIVMLTKRYLVCNNVDMTTHCHILFPFFRCSYVAMTAAYVHVLSALLFQFFPILWHITTWNSFESFNLSCYRI